MNRELRFRVWGRQLGQKTLSMSEPFGLEDICKECGTYNGPRGHDMDPEAIVVQFTGLKDKNGKEIYEGDIVRHKQGLTDEYDTYPIDSLEWFYFIQGNSELPYNWESKQFEVIGNIYENPELLNKEEGLNV